MPGLQQIRRYYQDRTPVADMIYNAESDRLPIGAVLETVQGSVAIPEFDRQETLLIPAVRHGRRVSELRELASIREFCREQAAALPERMKRLNDPDEYPIGFASDLLALRDDLITDVIGRQDTGIGQAVEREGE
jgi:hypothetical protein